MRKEAKVARKVDVAHIDGYHCGSHEKYCVFSSDRPIITDSDYRDADGNQMPIYGIEVETQNWGITNNTIYANLLKNVVFASFPQNLWKMERDGSLGCGCDSSAECITQPMTKAFIRNHYRDFKVMFDWFGNLGIKCDETGDCGMHTHISTMCFGREKKTQDEAIRKFLYIVNRHYPLMMKLVYRKPDRRGSTHYFAQMDYSNFRNCDLNDFWDDHNVCINMGHYAEGNIELRLVGGQKNFPCFRNTMESIFHLVEVSKRISWSDCDDITKVFSGCNNYVFDRLSSYVREADLITDSQLETIRRTVVYKEFI